MLLHMIMFTAEPMYSPLPQHCEGGAGGVAERTRRGAAYRLSTAEARRANQSLQASPSPGRHDFLVAESRGAASMVDASEQLERGHAIPTTL